jgi:enoyl-CoA hydratase/carnithine racemase
MSGIEIDFEGPVARLSMNFGGKLNLIGKAAIDDLKAAVLSLRDREGLRVALLAGAPGKAFAGGVDIREMRHLAPGSAREFISALAGVFRAIRELEIPVVAVIRGYAIGGGLELAMACDMRIAASDARFGMPEVKVGIPSVIEAALLPRLVGWGRAQYLLYTGEMIDADRALNIGLVDRVATHAELDQNARELVEQIASCGPAAIRAQKRLFRTWYESHLESSVAAGIEEFDRTFETTDPHEGMNAFLEKRPARFED